MVKPQEGLRCIAYYNNDKDKETWVYDLCLEKDKKAVVGTFANYLEVEAFVDKHKMETVDIQ